MRTINRTIGFFLLSLLLLASDQGEAQRSANYCATDQVHRQIMKNASPGMRERIAEKEKEGRRNWTQTDQRAGQKFVIPVVFHVIHDNGPENLDRQVILNQVEQMTTDFRKNNGDTSNINSNFKSLATDVEVEFRLAQKDPNGDCHSGINRIQSDLTYDGSFNSGIKDLIQWDRSSYLNIWVCNSIGNGIAGYALKPSGAQWNASKDGIVVDYQYVGKDRHTLTHESGHYLSLNHPWGSCGNPGESVNCTNSNCDNSSCGNNQYYDDGICDTPHTIGWRTCDPNGSSCGSLDNVQNYMSYSYCHLMFTADQATSMRNALQSSTADRNQLWTSTNLQETGTNGQDNLCKAKFRVDKQVVCKGQDVQFSDLSYHGPSSWSWEFEGGSPNVSSAQNPSVSYSDTGRYDVTLVAENSNGKDTVHKKDHIVVLPDSANAFPFMHPLNYIADLDKHPMFFVENPNGDSVAWKHTEQAGESGSNGSVMLENYENPGGQVDALTTTTMDASDIPDGNLELSFDIAYAKTNSGDQDELVIYASKNCGQNWSQRATYTASDMSTGPNTTSPFYPDTSQWKHKTLNSPLVSTYNVKDLRFKFEFVSDGGNNVFIDNINVHDEKEVSVEEEDKDASSWSLYPNPVEDRATLELDLQEKEQVSVDVLDLRGKKVLDVRNGETLSAGQHRIRMDLSDLGVGAYFVRVRTGDDERSTKKLFKR